MKGRLEHDLKISNEILEKIKYAPMYVQEWNNYLIAEEKTAATRKDFINKTLRFLSFIKKDICLVKLSDITQSAIVNYFSSLQTKNRNGKITYTSDSYKQTVWSCLNNFLNYLKQTGQIENNYMSLIKRPQNKDLIRINNTRTLLSKEDFSAILNSVKKGVGTSKARIAQAPFRSRDMSIMLLFMTTGIRKTALTEINVSDIDIDTKTLVIVDKGDVEQKYHLSDMCCDAIKQWLCVRDDYAHFMEQALFVSNNGNRMAGNTVDKLVKKYTEDAIGVPLSPHKLRAGFCSILYEEKGDIEFVRRSVGHSNVSTTMRYIVTDNKEREEASEIINSIFA